METSLFLVGQLRNDALPGKPAFGLLLESVGQIVVHEHGRTGHENRIEPVDLRIGEQPAKSGHGPAGLLVEQVPHLGSDGRGLFIISDHNGADRVAQRVHLGLEDR